MKPKEQHEQFLANADKVKIVQYRQDAFPLRPSATLRLRVNRDLIKRFPGGAAHQRSVTAFTGWTM
jgi:hypothetical protein